MSPVTPTLGTQIKQRRAALGVSQSAAPRIAGVARSTWVAWEKDESVPGDYNYAGIEKALEWAPGSVAAILDGRSPTPRQDDSDVLSAPPGYDPARWASYTKEDQEMLLSIIGLAEGRKSTQNPSKEGQPPRAS